MRKDTRRDGRTFAPAFLDIHENAEDETEAYETAPNPAVVPRID